MSPRPENALTSIIGYLTFWKKQDDLPAGTRDYAHPAAEVRTAGHHCGGPVRLGATSGSEAGHRTAGPCVGRAPTLGDMDRPSGIQAFRVKATMPEERHRAGGQRQAVPRRKTSSRQCAALFAGGHAHLSGGLLGDIATRLTLTNTASYEMNFAPTTCSSALVGRRQP